VAVFLHWLTGSVGVTLGVHRLITHHSFQPPILCARLKATAGSETQKGIDIGVGDGSFP
jgi:stearoyl-CoA desaturase (delta-9 desaturase)